MSGPSPIGEPPAPAPAPGAAVLRGGAWHALSHLLPHVLLFVQSVVVARFLGPGGMGRQSFIAFVELSAVALLSSGLATSLMRFVGESLGRGEAERARGLAAWAARLMAAAGALAAAMVALPGALGSDPRAAWALAGVAAGLGVIQSVPTAVLLGMQRFREASLISLATGAAGTAGAVAVLWAGAGIPGLFAVEAAVAAGSLAWLAPLARRALSEVAPVPADPGKLRRAALRFALAASAETVLALVVFRRSELLALQRWGTDADIAYYSISFALVTALVRLPEAFSAALIPALARLEGAGEQARAAAGFGRALRLLVGASFPLASLAAALGPVAVELFYGPAYRPAAPALTVLVAALPVFALGGGAYAVVTARADARGLLTAGGAAAAVDVVLALALVPALKSLGAALANVGAQTTAAALALAFAASAMGPVEWRAGVLARNLGASVAAGAAAAATASSFGLPAALPAGAAAWAAVYGGLALGLGVLAPDDARWLADAVGERVPAGRVLTRLGGPRSGAS